MKFKPYIAINIYYQDGDTAFDNKLRKLAIELDGEEGGSGFGGGYRDISFLFEDLEQAHQFFLRVRRFKKMSQIGSRIGSQSMLHEDDF